MKFGDMVYFDDNKEMFVYCVVRLDIGYVWVEQLLFCMCYFVINVCVISIVGDEIDVELNFYFYCFCFDMEEDSWFGKRCD